MKKLIIIVVAILVMTLATCSLVGCTKLSPDDGIAKLKDAYANSIKDSGIYQFSEKIYEKATSDKEGFIINRKVNVNCAVDKDYNKVPDKDFSISIHEDKYIEDIDSGSKIINKMIAYNDIQVSETTLESDKNSTCDAIFVGTGDLVDGKMQNHGYVKEGVTAKDFYDSSYFAREQLMNKQVMVEIGLLLDRTDDMDFDIKKGGIVKKGKTIDYTFKVSDEYLKDFEKTYNIPSIFDGKYVWIQTIYDRIANVYVYQDEKLGGDLSVEYEQYMFMITYLGPRVVDKKYPDTSGAESGYEINEDIYDIATNTFNTSYISSKI